MRQFILGFLASILLISLSILLFYLFGKKLWYPYYEKLTLKRDVKPMECPKCPEPKIIERNITIVKEENLTSEQRIKMALGKSGFVLYPKELTIIGLKYEKKLEVWGRLNKREKWKYIQNYPFTAFSGRLGAKLREGDKQIPEGIYGIEYLNPKSKFHLSMKLSYPNSFDREMAKREHRKNLGGDIMIHGKDRTVGCIPIGDDKIEELYFLVEKVGIENVKVILSPVDFRRMSVKIKTKKHPWFKKLYGDIKKELKNFNK